MNWEAVGATAEMLGATGVIVTLVYLAVQVRQNTAALQSTSEADLAKSYAHWHSMPATDPELGRCFDLGSSGQHMTDEELRRFRWYVATFFYLCEAAYCHYARGQISQETWDANVHSLLRLLANDLTREWWDSRVSQFSPGFRNFLNDARTSAKYAVSELSEIPQAAERYE
ncbi:MAG: hypothetical protein ACU84Q_13935 [Gammaproteobacteria bacterium]